MSRSLATAACFVLPTLLGGAVADHLLTSANDPHPELVSWVRAHARPERIASPRGPATRVAIVLLDGVGEPFLQHGIDEGTLHDLRASLRIDTATPSLSRPGYHALFTGVTQEVSGVRNNRYAGPARFDTLMDRVRHEGGSVAWALETVDWMYGLAGAPGEAYAARRDALDVDRVAALARSHTLTVVHWTRTDDAGHTWGAASERYAAEVRASLARVEALRARLSADGVTMWVGADHGHVARGGHGGPEPEVTHVMWVQLGGPRAPAAVVGAERRPVFEATQAFAQALGVQGPLHARDRKDPALTEENALRERLRRRASTRSLVALAAYVAAVFALASRLPSTLRHRGIRALASVLALGAAGALACDLLGPGWTLSAIRERSDFVARTLVAIGVGAALAWPLARAITRARTRDAALASGLIPLGSLAYALGSAGTSLLGDHALLVAPMTGLFPAGCCVALWIWAGRRD